MSKIILNNLSVPYVIQKFNDHNKIKRNLLLSIDTSAHEKLEADNEYYNDNIHKLDWHKNKDFERIFTFFKYTNFYNDKAIRF